MNRVPYNILSFQELEPEAYPMYKRVQYETYMCEELKKELIPLQNWLVNWTGIFLHSVFHHFKDIKKFNSVLFCLYQSQSYQIEWIIFTLFSGHYDIVYRELRCVLENTFYHFYYDYQIDERDLSIEQKQQGLISRSEKSYGKLVFQISGYKKWEEVYKEIYKPLCKYVHTNIGAKNSLKIYEEGFNALLDPRFDLDKFHESHRMLKKIINLQVELMEIVLLETYGLKAEYRCVF